MNDNKTKYFLYVLTILFSSHMIYRKENYCSNFYQREKLKIKEGKWPSSKVESPIETASLALLLQLHDLPPCSLNFLSIHLNPKDKLRITSTFHPPHLLWIPIDNCKKHLLLFREAGKSMCSLASSPSLQSARKTRCWGLFSVFLFSHL